MISHQICQTAEPVAYRENLRNILQVLGASLFIALCAQISIPLYFTPVPLTGQTFAVMLIAASMGSKRGFFAVLTYLMEGTLGLPVFASGSAGFFHLLGPTGGYLIGFLFQAYLVGWYMERQKVFSHLKSLTVLLSSSLVALSLGASWLALFIGIQYAFLFGVFPFIMGELLKAIGVMVYLKCNEKNSHL